MSIQVNPSAWRSVFAVPTAVTDEHIKRASGQQLKVLLYILRHNGEDVTKEQLAQGTGLTTDDASDCMQYWIETGFLYRDGAEPAPLEPAAPVPAREAPSQTEPVKRQVTEIPDVPPTYEQVAARTAESPEVAGLFQEVQGIMGKTIGYNNQCRLLMMMDDYGLPPEVILTIVTYSVSHGKTGMSYITKVGKNWAEEGIDTLEKAAERVEYLTRQEDLWKEFVSGIQGERPSWTQSRAKYFNKWAQEWGMSLELIRYAYEITIENTNKVQFSYTDKILESWKDAGYKTPAEAMQEKKGRTAAPKTGNGHSAAPSYDSELYRKKAVGPIEYKKKGE